VVGTEKLKDGPFLSFGFSVPGLSSSAFIFTGDVVAVVVDKVISDFGGFVSVGGLNDWSGVVVKLFVVPEPNMNPEEGVGLLWIGSVEVEVDPNINLEVVGTEKLKDGPFLSFGFSVPGLSASQHAHFKSESLFEAKQSEQLHPGVVVVVVVMTEVVIGVGVISGFGRVEVVDGWNGVEVVVEPNVNGEGVGFVVVVDDDVDVALFVVAPNVKLEVVGTEKLKDGPFLSFGFSVPGLSASQHAHFKSESLFGAKQSEQLHPGVVVVVVVMAVGMIGVGRISVEVSFFSIAGVGVSKTISLGCSLVIFLSDEEIGNKS